MDYNKLSGSCYAVKLSTGETLLTGSTYISNGMIHFLYPLKINFTPMLFKDKIVTNYVPILFQPFGENPFIPISAENVMSIQKASDADRRFYENSLRSLLIEEAKRLLAFDSIMNRVDYYDKLIMDSPATIQ